MGGTQRPTMSFLRHERNHPEITVQLASCIGEMNAGMTTSSALKRCRQMKHEIKKVLLGHHL